MSLSTLPHDVHSIIWKSLDLQDVLRLRQMNSMFSTMISEDKQLWAHILDRDVKARSLCLPSNICSIEEAGAHDIESWVKHAILLEHSYKTPDRKLSSRKIEIRRGLHVTWVKLILGRWCLIAASDDDVNELSMWEILPGSGVRCAGRGYLEAPFIDGQIDDTAGEVRCAITVGTTQPYIIVLGINQSISHVIFRELAHICDASHLLFFRGDLVGFAVHTGDDTYPYLANWKTGNLHALCLPPTTIPENPCPLPIQSCKAMTVQDGFAFTLHRSAIHIFTEPRVTEGASSGYARHVIALSAQTEVFSGHFLYVSTESIYPGNTAVVRMLCQSRFSGLSQIRVLFDSNGAEPGFSIETDFIREPSNHILHRCLHLCQFGSCARLAFCATSLRSRQWWNPYLLFAFIPASDDANVANDCPIENVYTSFSREGLPLSHLLSCVDFDDGSGLLLLGTYHGDIQLASVLSRAALTSGSLRSNLRICSENDGTAKKLPRIPVTLDLPLFYSIRKTYRPEETLPHKLIERAASLWRITETNAITLSGWSNDWLEFEHVWDWIEPLSRWGILDPDAVRLPVATTVRHRLHALGEMIPVLYYTQNHRQVVFRIGQRLFYCRMQKAGRAYDEEDEEVFELHPLGILGVLPITYNEFLNNVSSILPSISDYSIQTNLDSWVYATSFYHRTVIANCVYRIRNYLEGGPEGALRAPIDDGMMDNWADEQWDKIMFPAVGWAYHPYLGPPPYE